MKPNLNTIDRVVRFFIAVILAVLYYQGTIYGIWGLALVIFGGILLLTSIVSFCPLYRIFGISTCKVKQT